MGKEYCLPYRVRDSILTKHYSIRTEHACVDWKHPSEMGMAEI